MQHALPFIDLRQYPSLELRLTPKGNDCEVFECWLYTSCCQFIPQSADLDAHSPSYSVPIFDEEKQVWYLVDPENTKDKNEIMLSFGPNNKIVYSGKSSISNYHDRATLTRESILFTLYSYKDKLMWTATLQEKHKKTIEKIDEMLAYFKQRLDFDFWPTLRLFIWES